MLYNESIYQLNEELGRNCGVIEMDDNQGRKLYHHLVGCLELTSEQKQILWDELQNWFGTNPEEYAEPPETEESAKEQVLQLIHRMG
ncbi:hypothetical protein [Kroppenstedtia sanguinis]|uniref:hypothetical protein n=1 Tax=Kroppenstedtia sanguinis TaxID=1380684 RepID=UPI0036D3E923